MKFKMQLGVAEFVVLVVAGVDTRARELASAVETGGDCTAATATGVREGLERLDDHRFDAVVLEVPDENPEDVVDSLSDGADERPLVAVLDGSSIGPETALAAGATEVVDGPNERPAVLANRLDLSLSAARATRTARGTRQRYHRLLDASPAAIIIYDDAFELLYANDAAASLVGAEDPHDLVGRGLFEFVDGEYEQDVRTQIESLLERDHPVRCEEVGLVGVDGETRFVEAASSPVTVDGDPGGQAVLTDVTTLKERERHLRSQRDRFTSLFESLPKPAVHVRFEDGPIVQNVNTAFEEVFGYRVDALKGENLNDAIIPDGRMEEAREIDERTAAGHEVERDVRREAADGVREFRFSTRSVYTADGTDEGIGIYVDITDRKQREQALQRQNERLDAFASIVSHDLRNPLSVANGNLHLARDEDDETYLDEVDRALDRMERIIEDLLRLARSGEGSVDLAPVPAGDVATEAWQAADVEGGAFHNELDVTIEADRSQLRELLENLLRNAVEHGDDVTVSADVLDAADGEDSTGFYVADDGPGIPEDERDAVFEPGYTTHDEGTGFGLVVVEEIARAHGWTPSVTESETGGSRFEFRNVDPV
jgi:PAS domain S-box-containing protein